jgi:hypothetical protein
MAGKGKGKRSATRGKGPDALSLDGLIVWADCSVQVIEGGRWRTIATPLYTPLAINKALSDAGLAWAFVWFMGDREIWNAGKAGERLASREKAK